MCSSVIIEDIKRRRDPETEGLAYLYCVFNESHQSVENLLGSLVQQLARQAPELLDEVKTLYGSRQINHQERPSLQELETLLEIYVASFDRPYLVVDALDELPQQDGTRERFLNRLLASCSNARILITSRHIAISQVLKPDRILEI